MKTDCLILGAGASGLAAAAALSRAGLRVTMLERLDRAGKKLLATGNGRCNLSNQDLTPVHYGDAADFVSALYEKTPPDEIASFFSGLGLMTAVEDGRIYPRSMQAASVLDVLRAGCEGVTLITGCEVERLTLSRRGGWSVLCKNGEGFLAPVVLCAMGGSAAPQFGTDGSGTQMLADLGHSVTPLRPALVQLRCSHPALKSLKGIRTQATLTLLADGVPVAHETGELLFADYGVSGVCVFQLSRFASKFLDAKKHVELRVHLLPEVEDISCWLDARIDALPNASALSLFTGVFPRMLAQAIVKEAGLSLDLSVEQLGARQRQDLANAVSAFSLSVTGTQGFAQAQVTSGGVALSEVDPNTMQSRLFDGLYLTGELLDVDGPCGGYNLHFAFASGLTAAKAILSR